MRIVALRFWGKNGIATRRSEFSHPTRATLATLAQAEGAMIDSAIDSTRADLSPQR